ncbi:MAG: chemotaxis protein CheA [Steroidobacteraceae bacterium]|nr:chemotaxis protein CheA [Nevskiaceae bacterium]MCP5471605.1 chemotaxis protein CheA [Nevskiaceae bacterium]
MTIDLTQFHESFYEESFEAIASMEDALLQLRIGMPDPATVNTIFRVAHSIKGGAATFGFNEITSFTHTLETLLDELRAQRMQVSQQISDLLLKSVDVLRDMLRAQQYGKPADAQAVVDLQFDLELVVAQKGPAPSAVLPRWRIEFRPFLQLLSRGNDPLRMFCELAELGDLAVTSDVSAIPPLAEMDPENCYIHWTLELQTAAPREAIAQAFDWAEGDCELSIEPLEPVSVSVATNVVPPALQAAPAPVAAESAATVVAIESAAPPAAPHPVEQAVKSAGAAGGYSSSIRVSIEKIDELMNNVGELVITQSMLSQIGNAFHGPQGERLRAGLMQLERSVRELQESVMRVRMVPISFVFSRFPRMVRDLSQRLGKSVELKMTGGETEFDKTVLEKIGDPLVHLVRNGIDHGIETRQVRLARGKPETGTLHLHAYHRGGNITVEVSEDGAGLKREKILAKAKSKNLVAPDVELTDAQVNELIFLPGFSTADQATDVSGRGVGMDVVRRNIEELGGTVEIRSEEGKGSRFIINLPLTLAIVDGQIISVDGERYIVPLTAIVESQQLRPGMIQPVVGHGEVLSFRGEYLPVLRLPEVFGCGAGARDNSGLVMVVEGDGRRVGICVDELMEQQQVVVKALETNYQRVDGVAGATILGDGSVALILDIAGLSRRPVDRVAA